MATTNEAEFSRDAAIARMDRVISELKDEFDAGLDEQLSSIRRTIAKLAEAPVGKTAQDVGELRRLLHDLRGMAETFGFPLVNKVANTAYHAAQLDLGEAGSKTRACLTAHADALILLAERESRGQVEDDELILIQSLDETVAILSRG